MKCPICGSTGLKTTNTRSTKSGSQTWRRKECKKCHSSITTYEKPDMGWLSLKYAAKNISLPYSRSLLNKSILLVFDDEELQSINIENVLDTIEQKIVSTRKTIITNFELIKIVLNTLSPISANAAIKYFANHNKSVGYKNIKNLVKII